MTINVFSLSPTEQIFTHIEPNSKVNTTIAASSLQTALRAKQHDLCTIPLTAKNAELLMRNHGLERHRLRKLTILCRRYPILVLEWPDGTHLIADGTHSFVWQWQHGYTSALAWLVPQALWQPFVVEGLLDTDERALLSSFSGIR